MLWTKYKARRIAQQTIHSYIGYIWELGWGFLHYYFVEQYNKGVLFL